MILFLTMLLVMSWCAGAVLIAVGGCLLIILVLDIITRSVNVIIKKVKGDK